MEKDTVSVRDRVISYMKQHAGIPIDGSELMVVAGVSDWARRVSELQVQFGWWIFSGITLKQMSQSQSDNA